jgi:hypothetical protein
MVMKMILSTPSTISRKVRVNRLIQTWAEEKSGIASKKQVIILLFV